jgi:hypothetical protein
MSSEMRKDRARNSGDEKSRKERCNGKRKNKAWKMTQPAGTE